MKTIKENLSYLLSTALGALTFVFFAIPYLSAYIEVFGKKASEGISGYKVMDLWDGGFAGVMSSLFQILVLVGAVALLAWGVCGLLKSFGIFNAFPEKLGSFTSKKLAQYGLFCYSALNLLLLVFLIILTVANSDGNEWASGGISLSAGVFVTLVLAIGASVASLLLDKPAANAAPNEDVSPAEESANEEA